MSDPSKPPVQQAPYLRPPAADGGINALIPYKNGKALASYYLGLFSIFPLLGLFMGIAAIYLGVKGRKFAKEHPEAKGATHAWVGIIGGTIGALLNVLFWAVLIGLFFAHAAKSVEPSSAATLIVAMLS